MACNACERRRAAMLAERDRRAKEGQRVVPAVIGATVAAIDAVARKKKEPKR